MPGNVTCDWCNKHIGDDKLAYFSDREKNLDFCSEDCHSKWNMITFEHNRTLSFNWADIHSDFTPELQQKWEEREFSYKECKEWVDKGLHPDEYGLVAYLRDQSHSPSSLTQELINEHTWRDVDKNFTYREKKYWEWQNFDRQQTEQWIKSGLLFDDYEFADYLRQKGYKPQQSLNKERLRKEFVLDYSPKEKKEIIKLDIRGKKLEGSLNLSEFTNLKYLNCSLNQITNINISNCKKLERLYCNFNKLTNLDITDLTELELLECSNNQLEQFDFSSLNPNKLVWLHIEDNNLPRQDLSVFSDFVNLRLLSIGNTNNKDNLSQKNRNRFYGSLESLKNLKKLGGLHIANTDIEVNLEYLPKNIENEWINRGFNHEQIKEWLDTGLTINEYEYAQRFRDTESGDFSESEELKNDYENYLKEIRKNQTSIFTMCSICSWLNKWWKKYKATLLTDEELIKKIKDLKLSCTSGKLSVVKYDSLMSELIPNKELREKYGKLCFECSQFDEEDYWNNLCRSCSIKHFQSEFKNWTSGNLEIDRFIQQYQLKAKRSAGVLEWIPYERLTNIEYLAKGGFSTVYKAKWLDGYVKYWNIKENRWEREDNFYTRDVALKILHNSKNITADFLREVTHNRLFNNYVVGCYGISQDPKTKNYIMVMVYMPEGNLEQFLKSKGYKKFLLNLKFKQICHIVKGLNLIHQQGLIHRDLHPGNILNGYGSSWISDLGLCRLVDEKDGKKIFGVLPYVAPEVLNRKGYSQASDIYSFGILTCKIFTGLSPYVVYNKEINGYEEIPHDFDLAMEICQGLRPNLDDAPIPKLLENLIKCCWDADPKQRPEIDEIEKKLSSWCDEINREEDTEFCKQYKKAEKKVKVKEFKGWVDDLIRSHQATYISRSLEFENLPQPKNNSSKEWQAYTSLNLQIKAIEKEIKAFKEPLNSKQINLLEQFIQVNKKTIRNKDDKQAKKEVGKLEEKLESEGFLTKDIEKIIRHCERLVVLEKEIVQIEYQCSQVEISPK